MKPGLIFISFCVAEVLTALTITNGPQNTTVCINQLANCTCGFTGVGPNTVIPSWRIIKRRNGVIVSTDTFGGIDIIQNTIDGLEWIADTLNGNNSVLRVGPVDGTDNQSSYQCTFSLDRMIESAIGILTVVDPPSLINITVEDTGTTFITISWISRSVGSVTYTISLSSSTGDVIMSHIADDTQYTINGLTSGTSYRISVVPSVGMCQGEGKEVMVDTTRVSPNVPIGDTSLTSVVMMPTVMTDEDTQTTEDSNTTIIIIIVIIVTVVILAVIVVIIVAVMYWKYKQTKPSKNLTNRVESVDGSEENERNKETREGQNQNDSEYAYARTGPVGVSFLSN